MQELGDQYPNDDKTDPSGFLRRSRLHQSRFRAGVLNLPPARYGNYLTREDGESGNNFFTGFGIFDTVKNDKKYSEPLYSNLLRSEHIPFNFFIPFDSNKIYCKNVFNEFFNNSIQTIDLIKIEFAPKPKEKYLNDRTSFDAYVEYTSCDNSKGILGIEVKYTEKEYPLIEGSTQWKAIRDTSSKYYSVSEHSGLYRPEAINFLTTDNFRQIWRNQLLGESILFADSEKFQNFNSITLFPESNTHFIKVSKEYCDLLIKNDKKFLPMTYEDFISASIKHCPDKNYRKWLDYLTARYIVTNEDM